MIHKDGWIRWLRWSPLCILLLYVLCYGILLFGPILLLFHKIWTSTMYWCGAGWQARLTWSGKHVLPSFLYSLVLHPACMNSKKWYCDIILGSMDALYPVSDVSPNTVPDILLMRSHLQNNWIIVRLYTLIIYIDVLLNYLADRHFLPWSMYGLKSCKRGQKDAISLSKMPRLQISESIQLMLVEVWHWIVLVPSEMILQTRLSLQ